MSGKLPQEMTREERLLAMRAEMRQGANNLPSAPTTDRRPLVENDAPGQMQQAMQPSGTYTAPPGFSIVPTYAWERLVGTTTDALSILTVGRNKQQCVEHERAAEDRKYAVSFAKEFVALSKTTIAEKADDIVNSLSKLSTIHGKSSLIAGNINIILSNVDPDWREELIQTVNAILKDVSFMRDEVVAKRVMKTWVLGRSVEFAAQSDL